MRVPVLLSSCVLFIAISACTTKHDKEMTPPADNFSLDFNTFQWVHAPKNFVLAEKEIQITTEPGTDYWQRTYYGFQNDNAPTFLKNIVGDFSFSVRTDFDSKKQFDQCGIILYQNSENWVKASIEYENGRFSRLGSVVTNMGYSDWATTDISTDTKTMWYRLSRRGPDFFIEASVDGAVFKQLRVLHMHQPIEVARVGIYACSPVQSSFTAKFSDFKLGPSLWQPHVAE